MVRSRGKIEVQPGAKTTVLLSLRPIANNHGHISNVRDDSTRLILRELNLVLLEAFLEQRQLNHLISAMYPSHIFLHIMVETGSSQVRIGARRVQCGSSLNGRKVTVLLGK